VPNKRDAQSDAQSDARNDVQSDAGLPAVRPARRLGWASTTSAAVFGLIYAYYLWDAIRSLVVLPGYYESAGLGRGAAPWTLLIAGLVIPIVGYAAAFLLGLRRKLFGRALIFLVGLAAVACLSLGVIALGK
jgi:hypothetical protein